MPSIPIYRNLVGGAFALSWVSLVILAPTEATRSRFTVAFLLLLPVLLTLGVMLCTWVVWMMKLSRSSRAYMTADAVMVITATSDGGTLRWSIGEHTTSRVGCGRGARFRATIVAPLQVEADAVGAEIYGKAANTKVRDLYLKQFTGWGLVAVPGSTKDVYRPPVAPPSGSAPAA